MSDSAVLNSLENKYNEKFTIISSDYISDIGLYDVRVSPVSNENIVFKVDHDPKKNHVNDYYPYAIWQYEGQQYVESILQETEIPFALMCGVSSTVEFENKSIPSFSEILKNNPDKLSLNIKLHLFGEIDENTLQAQLILDEKLRQKDIKKVGFSTSIYDINSLEGGEITDENFDFGVSSENTFESENKDHFLGLLKYRINNDNNTPTHDDLISIMVDNPNHMMFKKL